MDVRVCAIRAGEEEVTEAAPVFETEAAPDVEMTEAGGSHIEGECGTLEPTVEADATARTANTADSDVDVTLPTAAGRSGGVDGANTLSREDMEDDQMFMLMEELSRASPVKKKQRTEEPERIRKISRIHDRWIRRDGSQRKQQ